MADEKQLNDAAQDAIWNCQQWVTADEVQARVQAHGLQLPQLAEWEERGIIFGVERDGAHVYADFQFGVEGQPRPIVHEVLKLLAKTDPWAIAAWFHFPNSWIVDPADSTVALAPKNALYMEDPILHAAANSRNTYVA